MMQFLLFIISYPIIWVLSRLPMSMLYLLSDVLYFLIYTVFGYRKQVVLENLKLVFPEKTTIERKKIAKQFFTHFTDLFVESIKAFSISKKEISKRYVYKNPELVNNYYKKQRSIALVGAHQANWEWSISLPLVLDTPIYGAYTRLSNKYFEKWVRESREKFGCIGYKTSEMVKGMQQRFADKEQGAYLLLSDQSPQVHKTYYWSEFFGIKVPIHTGAEMLSKKFDLVIINYITKKIKRGYYETEFQLITDTPKEFEDYEITDKYIALTEKNILKQPEFYLWSHKRFKHRDKMPTGFL